MKKFLKFIILFPIIFVVVLFVLGFSFSWLDHTTHFHLFGSLFPDVLYSRKFVHHRAPMKECFSDIRVISGAIEMYNMDNPVMIKDLNNETLQTLRDLKYLKDQYPHISSSDDKRNKCKYRTTGDLTGVGYIYCEYHGEADPLGKIKPSKEYYDDVKRDERRKKIYTILHVFPQWGFFIIVAGAITWFLL